AKAPKRQPQFAANVDTPLIAGSARRWASYIAQPTQQGRLTPSLDDEGLLAKCSAELLHIMFLVQLARQELEANAPEWKPGQALDYIVAKV
ncbi:hypothetical protein ABXW85_18580, partial [Streptococcus suis]